jgi:hypothetical protein
MDILAAIKREERKLEKQLHKLRDKLNGIRAAAKALGDSKSKELKVVKERVFVCCCQREDRGYEETMGEVSGAGEESQRIVLVS